MSTCMLYITLHSDWWSRPAPNQTMPRIGLGTWNVYTWISLEWLDVPEGKRSTVAVIWTVVWLSFRYCCDHELHVYLMQYGQHNDSTWPIHNSVMDGLSSRTSGSVNNRTDSRLAQTVVRRHQLHIQTLIWDNTNYCNKCWTPNYAKHNGKAWQVDTIADFT